MLSFIINEYYCFGMKKILICGLLTACLGVCFVSCSNSDGKENDLPSLHGNNIVKTIDNLSGFMRYNQELGLWYIYYADFGVSDEMDRFYSDQFSKEFLQEGTRVVFSGDVYDIIIDSKYHFVGQNDYYLHPLKMEMIEEETVETVEDVQLNDAGKQAVASIVGKWQLVKQGTIEISEKQTVLEFMPEGMVIYDNNIGTDRNSRVRSERKFENDWIFDNQMLTGHLQFVMMKELGPDQPDRLLCTLKGDEMILLPDMGMYYLMNPTMYFVRIKE